MRPSDHGTPSIYQRLDTCRRLLHEDSSPFTSETAKYAPTSRSQGIFFYQGTDLHHKISNTIRLLDGLIEQAAFNQALVSHPEDKFASVLVGDLAQFVDTNSGVKIYGSKEEIRARKSPETVDAPGFAPDASIPVILYGMPDWIRTSGLWSRSYQAVKPETAAAQWFDHDCTNFRHFEEKPRTPCSAGRPKIGRAHV